MKIALLCLISLITAINGPLHASEIQTEIEKIDLKLNRDETAITFFNLKSGEATLIQNELGEAILINTGNMESNKEMEKYFKLYGVTKIRDIIITKMDPDYVGNLSWIVSKYKVDQVIVPASNKEKLMLNVPIMKWKPGQKTELLPSMRASVLQMMEEPASMNFSLTVGKHKFLWMSEGNRVAEERLMREYGLKQINILKVADYASEHSTSQAFLDAVDPQVAIIFHKKDTYPSADVLERLQETWIDIYYVKQFGNVTIKCKRDKYEVITITVESIHPVPVQ